MKKKKGFTLIELLAVIVILAIIAIIAVPIILNVIEKSKESSAVDSAYGYIHAIENGIVEKEVNDKVIVENREYEDLREFEREHNINIKGNKPVKGLFRLEKRQVVYAEFMIDGYSVVCEKRKCVAKGKGKIIEITYNASGGVVEKEIDKIIEGTSLELLPQPTREHYGFDGWYTEENGGGEKVYNTTIFNEDIILYANWIKDRYTISFDGNGGTPTENSISVEHEGTIEEFPRAEKEGYTFNGWYLEDNSAVTNKTVFTEAKTLYAHYTKNTYTVNFNGNGGTSSIASTSVEHGNTLTLPNATKEGYTFNGWYTEATGGSEVTNSTPIKGDMTLYAHYTINTYTVTYNADGGSVSPTSAQVIYGSTLTLPTPTKSGYTFIGWFTDNYTEITNSTTIFNNMTIKAAWTKSVTEFGYTGNVQEYRVYAGRKYKLEVWGAQGGYGDNGGAPKGLGGYSYGEIVASKNEVFYVYVGGKGADNSNTSCYAAAGGWNGGAQSGQESGEAVGAGGGASDIRCGSTSLFRRVIVAGGGGGDNQDTGNASYSAGGGGLNWTTATCSGYTPSTSYKAGVSYTSYTSQSTVVHPSFGAGGYETGCNSEATGGGGGGWYGGAAAGCSQDGQGGSGWLYTSTAYNSWKSASPNDANRYELNSSYYLSNAGGTNGNRSGHGYAKITYLGKN